MQNNYKKKTKKYLGCFMALAMVFLFANNSVAQCTLSLINTTDVSCYGQEDGSTIPQGTGGTGYYHYFLQIFNPTFNTWQQIAQSPASGGYTNGLVQFTQLTPDSFRVLMIDSLGCGDTANFGLTVVGN